MRLNNNNIDGKQCPFSSFELLGELPVELVADKILDRFADEKSLSTLALALSCSSDARYETIVYGTVPTLARQRLRQQASLIAGDETATVTDTIEDNQDDDDDDIDDHGSNGHCGTHAIAGTTSIQPLFYYHSGCQSSTGHAPHTHGTLSPRAV